MTTPKPTHRDTCIYVHIYTYLMIQNINTYMYIIYIYLYIYTWPWLSPLRGWDVWLWHSLENLYICLTISICYSYIAVTLGLIGRDGGLRTLCHSHGFACQQRVLKTFPGTGYPRSEDGIVWLWHSLVNLSGKSGKSMIHVFI